ncbi:hypothetical protein C5746_06800 [Streptomyces atratus]|uniref:Disease resistance R13L4/SHOC-2-like LRR domain-containing protein n=1 Tax=Streptomyces atratus TaxID=1893 RepID=A0A2Z5J8K2_STRAR|nr:hypothetical protein C5746_06800 [Streptomyces atratus]
MRPVLPPRGHEVIDARAAEERFGLSADIGKPGHDHASTIRLYGAGLHIRGDLVARHGARRCADNIVVDGDLVIDGALDWWEDPDGPQRFLLVTGDLKARSVHLGECVDLVVRGDVEVSGGVFAWSVGEGPLDGDTTLTARNVRARCVSLHGHVDMVVHGDLVAACGILGRGVDDRGSLSVAGRTRVGELVTADWFTVTPTGPREVGRSAAVDLRGLPEGLPELRELIRPELLGDVGDTDDPLGRELGDRIEATLAAGMPVLRDTPGPLLAASADEVARLRARPAEVTELDLATHRALWQDPERVLDFTALRRLRLAGNRWSGADRLLARLGKFPHLKELDISNMALAQLPAEICLLRGLQVLNIADNPLRALPDQLGDLSELRVLRTWKLSCPLPDALSRLPALEELDLSWLHPAPADRVEADPKLVPFPRLATRIPGLRRLNLSVAVLDSVPDDLLLATALEELNLDSALGRVERLPDLSRLPRLRVLRMNGNSGNADHYPGHRLLDRVWAITTLEELEISRWGEQTRYNERTGRGEGVRPPLTLPDDAFARLSRLRVLDLGFNGLTTLPESFYALTELEDVTIDFGLLDPPVRQRLAALARSEPDNPARDWIRAVQVKLLLKADRTDDAYQAANRTLARRPDFRGLADVAASAGYRTWRGDAA